ncbi:MAG: thiamine/thiamine pyrophosphate ABC transporter permease ThiP [Candidatus Arsenophonus melophagi]|nr:thiamine/thiamine pyrophosphate ABC transporter permease ThiP [Candidatus Arsenophonus melophagi]
MAKCCKPLIGSSLWPGIVISSLLITIVVVTFITLWIHVPQISLQGLIHDNYLWHVIAFTFLQALLSTLLSVIPAIFLAQSLFRRKFKGRILFLRLCSMTMVLPVLVAILGLLTVHGRFGWIAQSCQWLGIDYQFTPYGLKGIVLAHIFFNLPFAIRMLLLALESIAVEQRQLAAQLDMNTWQHFCILEWPYLRRQILPTASLIFMLCFTSFSTVLTLGGGPAATTIELALYQSLSYDFDLNKAALLALIQLFCCLGLVLLSQQLNVIFFVGASRQLQWKNPNDNRCQQLLDMLLISITLIFLLLPILAIILDGLNLTLLHALQQPSLWKACMNSIVIAISAGVLCIIFTIMLLWSSRELRLRRLILPYRMLEFSGLLILAMPSIVLSTGFFLLLNKIISFTGATYSLVILTNALIAIPCALKILEHPMYDLAERYNLLCLSLEIKGINRLMLIELKALKSKIAQAFAFACILSMGDFSIISLFGNENFRTLPYYLYQQLGSYHSDSAAVTALLMLLLCFSLFSLFERVSEQKHD